MSEIKPQILKILFDVLEEVNQQLPSDRRLEKTGDAVLYGKGATLDSLGLVNLIVAAEQRIEDAFQCRVSLADERAMSQGKSPFRTVETLASYACALVEERKPRA